MIEETLKEFLEIFMEGNMQVEESAVLETMELEVVEEPCFISEIDEVRVSETAEIMSDVFSKNVLVNWTDFTLDEKANKINEYYIRAGENLGIGVKGVVVEPMYTQQEGMICAGYNLGDGYIHINMAMLNEPSMLGEVLDTATHEMRHQFQTDALIYPEKFSDIPSDVWNAWQYEMTPGNYIDGNYDPQGYYEQAIECDARDFSEHVMNAYMQNMNLI